MEVLEAVKAWTRQLSTQIQSKKGRISFTQKSLIQCSLRKDRCAQLNKVKAQKRPLLLRILCQHEIRTWLELELTFSAHQPPVLPFDKYHNWTMQLIPARKQTPLLRQDLDCARLLCLLLRLKILLKGRMMPNCQAKQLVNPWQQIANKLNYSQKHSTKMSKAINLEHLKTMQVLTSSSQMTNSKKLKE